MNINDIWPYFVIMLAMLAAFSMREFSFLDESPQRNTHRFEALDGLRGVLALSVAIHHLSVQYGFIVHGSWALPDSRFYTLIGQSAVAGFFMITGFLFAGKVSTDHVNWSGLYKGRFLRIVPLYSVAVTIMIVIVMARSHYTLLVPVSQFMHEMLHWFAFGIPKTAAPVNGVKDAALVLAGVTWTIHYEWMFYFTLPVLYIFRRGMKVVSPIAAILLLAALHLTKNDAFSYAALFAFGVVARHWVKTDTRRRRGLVLSTVASLALVALFLEAHTAYSATSIIMLGVVFFAVCRGCTFFGLLVTDGAHRLGNISYSIYLLQGIPMALMFANAGTRQWAVASPFHFWIVGLCIVSVLAGVSCITYCQIEKRFIALGKKTIFSGKMARLRSGQPPMPKNL